MPWDEHDLNRQRVQKMVAEAALGAGVLVLDATGGPKQGKPTVGVARQSSGTLGKVGNCQIAVTCCDTAPQATWPVAVRLYLPTAWAVAAERRGKARGPAEVTFHTQPEVALALREEARAWGVLHRCVVAEADDGDHPNFLAGLEMRQERDVVGVRPDVRVSGQRNPTGPVPRADALLQALPPPAAAHQSLAAGGPGLAAQAVRGGAVLAGDQRRAPAGGRAAGGTRDAGAAGGAATRREPSVRHGHTGGAGGLCPPAVCRRAVP
jgi:DDE superfamily endonuclease